MQLHKFIGLTCLTLVIASCSEQQARKPVSHSSGSFMKESIQRNKKLVAKEEDAIAKIIKKDTTNAYIASEKGYWYTYEEKSTETTTPIRGDIAYFDYEITDLQFDDSQPIITTEKDAVKLLALLKQYPDFQREIWVVPVEAVLSSACYATLHQQLKQLGLNLPEGTL